MHMFKKKPVVVEAHPWLRNGDHPLDYSRDHEGLEGGVMRVFTSAERKARGWEGDIVRYYRRPEDSGDRACLHCGRVMDDHGWIDTREGGHIVCPGDMVITGVKGERYPCKPDIFAATYDAVDTATSGGRPILCIDFDGVLHSYISGWRGANIVADMPVPGAIAFLREAVQHFRVAIFSSRSNQLGGVQAMQQWLGRYVAEERLSDDEDLAWASAIEWPLEKPAAMVTLDDRALTFTGIFPAISQLQSFQPWNKKKV